MIKNGTLKVKDNFLHAEKNWKNQLLIGEIKSAGYGFHLHKAAPETHAVVE